MPQVRHTTRARRDLLDIWLYIGNDNPAAADRIYARLAARVRILEKRPNAGRARPELAPDARSLIEPPYLIFYRILPDGVQVVRILHGRRRISAALFREGTA